jgi:MarR family transcriptional regulator, transcriptional regulator for hemolysin
MPKSQTDFLFMLFETQRLLRLLAEKQAAPYGITKAQWGVLAKLERTEGLKQSELAEMLEVQPITLTRLIDRLCENDLIERREDPKDRRVNRLYLRPAARPLLEKLGELRSGITEIALNNFSPEEAKDLVRQLETIKNNVRDALQSADSKSKDQRYG